MECSQPVRIGYLRDQYKSQCFDRNRLICSKPGPAIEIIAMALSLANCSGRYFTPADNEFGDILENGSWNGLVGMLVKDQIDVSFPFMWPTMPRLDVVDFIPTRIFPTSTYLIFNRKALVAKRAFRWWYALSFELWIILLLSMCFTFTISVGSKNTSPGFKYILFGCMTAIEVCEILFEMVLLQALVFTIEPPITNMGEVIQKVSSGAFIFAATPSYKAAIMNQSDLKALADALNQTHPIFDSGQMLAALLVKNPRAFVFGEQYECDQVTTFAPHSFCFDLGYEAIYPGYTTSLVQQNSTFLRLLTTKYRYIESIGLAMAASKRYRRKSFKGVMSKGFSTLSHITIHHMEPTTFGYFVISFAEVLVIAIESLVWTVRNQSKK